MKDRFQVEIYAGARRQNYANITTPFGFDDACKEAVKWAFLQGYTKAKGEDWEPNPNTTYVFRQSCQITRDGESAMLVIYGPTNKGGTQ